MVILMKRLAINLGTDLATVCLCVCVGVQVCTRWHCYTELTVKLRPKVQVLLSDMSYISTQLMSMCRPK